VTVTADRGESAQVLPITAPVVYRVGVTASQEPNAADPTNADLLAFMKLGFAQLTTAIATTNAKVDELSVKLDDAKDELRGEIRATEATLTARINSVQEVIRSVKADTAAHLNDPTAHHRHAA
jgi:hypothetical protein